MKTLFPGDQVVHNDKAGRGRVIEVVDGVASVRWSVEVQRHKIDTLTRVMQIGKTYAHVNAPVWGVLSGVDETGQCTVLPRGGRERRSHRSVWCPVDTCVECKGTGYKNKRKCSHCSGNGFTAPDTSLTAQDVQESAWSGEVESPRPTYIVMGDHVRHLTRGRWHGEVVGIQYKRFDEHPDDHDELHVVVKADPPEGYSADTLIKLSRSEWGREPDDKLNDPVAQFKVGDAVRLIDNPRAWGIVHREEARYLGQSGRRVQRLTVTQSGVPRNHSWLAHQVERVMACDDCGGGGCLLCDGQGYEVCLNPPPVGTVLQKRMGSHTMEAVVTESKINLARLTMLPLDPDGKSETREVYGALRISKAGTPGTSIASERKRLAMWKRVEKGRLCKVCGGSGTNSKGHDCPSCAGAGWTMIATATPSPTKASTPATTVVSPSEPEHGSILIDMSNDAIAVFKYLSHKAGKHTVREYPFKSEPITMNTTVFMDVNPRVASPLMEECPRCEGTGKENHRTCSGCRGRGVINGVTKQWLTGEAMKEIAKDSPPTMPPTKDIDRPSIGAPKAPSAPEATPPAPYVKKGDILMKRTRDGGRGIVVRVGNVLGLPPQIKVEVIPGHGTNYHTIEDPSAYRWVGGSNWDWDNGGPSDSTPVGIHMGVCDRCHGTGTYLTGKTATTDERKIKTCEQCEGNGAVVVRRETPTSPIIVTPATGNDRRAAWENGREIKGGQVFERGAHDPQSPKVEQQALAQEAKPDRWADSDDSFAARRRKAQLQRKRAQLTKAAAEHDGETVNALQAELAAVEHEAATQRAKDLGHVHRECTVCDWDGWVDPEADDVSKCPLCDAWSRPFSPTIDTTTAPPPGGVAKGDRVRRWQRGKW